MEEKTERVYLRLTPQEKFTLKSEANDSKMSLSNYLITISENKKIIVVHDIPQLLIAIDRIGNNINQITAVVNAQKFVSEYQLDQVRRYMIDVDKIMNKILKSITDQDDSVDGSVYMKL